ncbi:hypothetical protein MVEN_01394400 [Mycena venus]|uniref:Uncharacterized protein n=1 Tax=Mycena venus TaxID=2733690 RepID=A0A8H6XV62_9AGAR|nr:hypothetical protein MVEN_01394400 [Mycena venus]
MTWVSLQYNTSPDQGVKSSICFPTSPLSTYATIGISLQAIGHAILTSTGCSWRMFPSPIACHISQQSNSSPHLRQLPLTRRSETIVFRLGLSSSVNLAEGIKVMVVGCDALDRP